MKEGSTAMRLRGKNVVVIGASRGLGREIVATAHAEGAHVLAVARGTEPLRQLAAELPGVQTLALDASEEIAPAQVMEMLAPAAPDVVVVAAGAIPHMAPLVEHNWETFSRAWNTDVKLSFLFTRDALARPLPPGTTVILISSGAAIGGSPLSGGYAGAKRMQIFLADYAQRESERLHRGLRFLEIVPGGIMPETELGRVAIEAYASAQGLSPAEYLERTAGRPTPEHVAQAVVECASDSQERAGKAFLVTGTGIKLLS